MTTTPLCRAAALAAAPLLLALGSTVVLASPASAAVQTHCTAPYQVGFTGEGRHCIQVRWTDTAGRGIEITNVRTYVTGDAQQRGFAWIDARLDAFQSTAYYDYPRKYNTDRDTGWGPNVYFDREIVFLRVFGRIDVDNFEDIPVDHNIEINGN